MKTCPHCRTDNAVGHKFCQQCGRALEAAPPSDATVRWTGQPVPGLNPLRHHKTLAKLFGDKDRIVLGRAPDCDVCLDHPTVSRYHARLERSAGGLLLRDLSSVNGVSVNGRRITDAAPLPDGVRVGIGPFLFTLSGGLIQSLDSSRSLRLEARSLEKVVPLNGGRSRKLLDDVNLVVNPGEFVSLLGPSGSGKSTLMDCLNGRRRATGGRILANGEDFYRHFDSFRQSLGYVPQQDIVHTQLTVYRALYYTAQLRLPPDTAPDELKARVEEVVKEMELGPHRDTLIGNLSGGQIKRVSLGAELLARPCMLYIDEATSGLDAGTEARMMKLFRRLADEGKSLLCITHNVDNVEQCHLILVLARGRLVYYGPPREAPHFFRVHRISEIYDRLAERPLDEWVMNYEASALHQDYIAARLLAPPTESSPSASSSSMPPVSGEASAPSAEAKPQEAPPRRPGWLAHSGKLFSLRSWAPQADRVRGISGSLLRWRELFAPLREMWHQFGVLTARYIDLVVGDARGFRLLLWQAPIVALFLLLGFQNSRYQDRIPLRYPADDERAVMEALKGVQTLAESKDDLTDEERAKLKQYVLSLPNEVKLDGPMLLAALRLSAGWAQGTDASKHFESVRFSFPVPVEGGGEPRQRTVSGADLLRIVRASDKGAILDQMLTTRDPMIPAPKPYPSPDDDQRLINPRHTYTLLFILVMIILWFGCNNAAKEIVKEEAIYGRERSVNLGIPPYLASKFLVLTVVTAFHVVSLMVILYGSLYLLAWLDPHGHSTPYPGHMIGYFGQFGVLMLLAMCGVALGLLLSACVSSPDRANALLPYVLIPQMILGGGFLPIKGVLLTVLAWTLSPVYWAYRGIHLGSHQLPPSFPGYTEDADGVGLPCLALTIQLVLLLAATAWCLKRKEA
jgi:ABC-type multidrug transport system ATPase subunit